MTSKIFAKQVSHGGLEVQSDSHGDTLMLLPSSLEKITGVSMVDMTEDTPILVVHMSNGDNNLEVPFASRTNIKRAYEQVISILTKQSK